MIAVDDVFAWPDWEDLAFIIFAGAAGLSVCRGAQEVDRLGAAGLLFCQGVQEVDRWRDFLETGAGPRDTECRWLLDGTVGLVTSSFILGPDLHVSGTPEHFAFAHWQATQANLLGIKRQSHRLFLHNMQAMLASMPSVEFSPSSTGECEELHLTIAWPVSGFRALLETGRTGDGGSAGSSTSM